MDSKIYLDLTDSSVCARIDCERKAKILKIFNFADEPSLAVYLCKKHEKLKITGFKNRASHGVLHGISIE
jgi:hypothetical protein